MKKGIYNNIYNFWNDYLSFGTIPNSGETKVISHNPSSQIPESEFYIFEYIGAGRVISVPKKYVKRITDLINNCGYSFDKLKTKFEDLMGTKAKVLGPIISQYLLSNEKTFQQNPEVKQLHNRDIQIYEDFIKSCVDGEIKEVDMNFNDSTHKFFVLFKNNIVVSLANYLINESNLIAHIGIITPKKFSGNGYGKTLVSSVVWHILDNGLIPQYRAEKNNIASCKIAEFLGFTPVIESYSFVKG